MINQADETKNNSVLWLIIFYVTAVVLLVLLYGQTINFAYVWDDKELFVYNPDLVSKPLSWDLISRPVLENTSYFRPLVFLSWFAEFYFFSLQPSISHGINVMCFFLSTLFLFHLLHHIFRHHRHNILLAGLGALTFLCHPMNVEAVAWVAGRFDVFATLFLLLAFYVFVAVRHKIAKIILISLAYFAALGSKEIGILLIPALFCIWMLDQHCNGEAWWPVIRRFFSENKWLLAILFAITLFYLYLRLQYGSGMTHSKLSRGFFEVFIYKHQTPILAIKEYLLRAILPFYNLGLFTPIDYFSSTGNKLISWIVVISLSSLLFIGIKKKKTAIFAMLGYFLMLSLVLYIIPLTTGFNLVQDRFMHSALPFYSILLVYLLSTLFHYTQKISTVIAPIIIYNILLIMITLQLIPIWRNEAVLWHNTSAYQERFTNEFHVMYLRALMEVEAPRKNIESLIQRERDSIKKTNTFRPIVFIMYGQYLVDHEDPEGIKILSEYSDALAEIAANYKAEGLTRSDIFAIYYSYAYGELLINSNLEKSIGIYDLMNKYKPPYRTGRTISLDILINLLQDKKTEASAYYKELLGIKNLDRSSFDAKMNDIVGRFCSKRPGKILACQKDFDISQLERL